MGSISNILSEKVRYKIVYAVSLTVKNIYTYIYK